MDSYFFIPGNKLENIDLINRLTPSELIIDIEDGVKQSERSSILERLKAGKGLKEHYIRIPLYDAPENEINTEYLQSLLQAGFDKFMFPKLSSGVDFEKVYADLGQFNVKVILLIETPRLLLEAQQILSRYPGCFSGLGLGSHDFMSVIGGVHNLKNLEVARQQILYLARMAGATAIDIASMELQNQSALEDEIMDGFMKGYDAKFFIHPWQLNIYNALALYTPDELKWALNVQNKLKTAGNVDEFNPIIINGNVIERPHLERAKKILKYFKHDAW